MTSVPLNRGRWRVTLHRRQYTPSTWQSTMIAELDGARGRRLDRALNTPAQATFTLEGRSTEAGLVTELAHDVIFWRWDDASGKDVAYFRGIVGQAEDQLDGPNDTHVVTFTCHDYLAMLARRFTTRTLAYTATDQDVILQMLVGEASAIRTTDGATTFTPGSYLPIGFHYVNGDGTDRGYSTEKRDRTYLGSTEIGQAVNDLAHVQSIANPLANAFDYELVPISADKGLNTTMDYLRVYYPSQGVLRAQPLEYGGALSAVTRTVNSGDYGNFVRVLGNNGDSNPATPQVKSEKWNTDANNVGQVPVGLWMLADNASSDTNGQSTLDETAQGLLNLNGVLVPSYTLGLTPGYFTEGVLGVGDTVPVVIESGTRLAVNTTLRIVGMSWDISDDADELVALTVGRPPLSLASMLVKTQKSVDALARR